MYTIATKNKKRYMKIQGKKLIKLFTNIKAMWEKCPAF